MKHFKEFMEEARNPRASYRYETSTGKIVGQADSKVSKVIAVLEEGTTSATATKLVRSYMKVEKKMKDLKSKLEEVKKFVRSDIIDNYFDTVDETYTRVIENAEITILVTKKTQTEDKKVTNYEKFVEEMIKLNPMMETAINELLAKYTEIKKGSVVASTIKVSSVGDKGEDVTESVSSILNFFKNFVKKFFGTYDKKIEDIKRKYLVKNLNESCEYCSTAQQVILTKDISEWQPVLQDAFDHYMFLDQVKSPNKFKISVKEEKVPNQATITYKHNGKEICVCKLIRAGININIACPPELNFPHVGDMIQHFRSLAVSKQSES